MNSNLTDMMGKLLAGVSPSPPRSLDALPGLRWRTAFDRRLLIPMLFFMSFFLLFPIMIFTTDPSGRMQFKRKEHVQGTVTTVKDTGTDQQQRRVVEYSFETKDHQPYRGKQVVHEHSPYFQIEAGASVPIIYAEDEAGLNGIDGVLGQESPPLAIFAIFPFFLLFFFFVFLGPTLIPNLRLLVEARKFFKRGIVVDAKIVFIKKRSGFGGFQFPTSRTEIYYSYTTGRGELVESKTTCDNDWLVNKLDIGSPIHVAYLERKPEKSTILEAFIR